MTRAVTAPREAPPFGSAVLIQDMNMNPEIRWGSVVFLGDEPGYSRPALYGIEVDGRFGGLYRAEYRDGGVRMWLDSTRTVQVVSPEVFKRINARLVLGVARPYSPDFAAFLRERFLGAA